ncbi:MAG TPA: ABC transporter substrate-binding protein [Stellaceae bacterium]|nr:ABC transporter substrate-binding protein [Stellaceae bacterium]
MRPQACVWAAGIGFALAATAPATAAETPKYGGTLTYMIPADAPPSFDAHHEQTFATIHTAAPFYSMLIRMDPNNPAAPGAFVCDLCTEMPKPTDDGKTYTFKIRTDVKFHNGDKLSADDVAASWNSIIFPPAGILSPRSSNYMMVKDVAATDPQTVVFHLKFATTAFLPALADAYNWIYEKKILDKDPHWYEKNIMGSGPFKFAGFEEGQLIKGVRNPDYYRKGLPYLDGFIGIYAPKQATQIDAIRADRAATEFRGYPPSAMDQLKEELGDKIKIQESDWNCGSTLIINHKKPPFDDVRVRRALTLAIDRWGSAPALSKIADVKTVGGIVFPGSPLAPTKAELQTIAGFWPDIEKSRAEARRLLKEAGQENLTFDVLNRNVDQPYKYVGTWVVDQWNKIGVHATQHVVPTGPWFSTQRSGDFDVNIGANCRSVVNPVIDVQPYLPSSLYKAQYGYFEDPKEVGLYDKVLHETDPQKQHADMFNFVKEVMDEQVHTAYLLWWYRRVPLRSYVNGWKISPSHYINQDLSTIWLSSPQCGECTEKPVMASK